MHVSLTLETVVACCLLVGVFSCNLLEIGECETIFANPHIAQCRLEDGIAHRYRVDLKLLGFKLVLDEFFPHKCSYGIVALWNLNIGSAWFLLLYIAKRVALEERSAIAENIVSTDIVQAGSR